MLNISEFIKVIRKLSEAKGIISGAYLLTKDEFMKGLLEEVECRLTDIVEELIENRLKEIETL